MTNKTNGVDTEATAIETQVMLLSDSPAEENGDVVRATAALIEAATSASLVAVICTHVESKKPATILCAMFQDESSPEIAQYIPLAMLFTEDNAPWAAYQPPAVASMVPEDTIDPMTVFSDPEETDRESESEETT